MIVVKNSGLFFFNFVKVNSKMGNLDLSGAIRLTCFGIERFKINKDDHY